MPRTTQIPPDDTDVSICIVNWNTRDVLRQSLRSIFSSDWSLSFETIVVDNASTDGSAGMVESEFPEVRLLKSQSNLLFARGINLAASRSRGRYLLIANSDVILNAACVQALADFLDRTPRAGACGPRLLRANGKPERPKNQFPSPWLEVARWFGFSALLRVRYGRTMTPYQSDWLSGACLLIRRNLGEELGFFDQDYDLYYEDVDLCHRIRNSGREVWIVPTSTATHLHAESTRLLTDRQRARFLYDGLLRFCGKHYSRHYQWLMSGMAAISVSVNMVQASLLNLLTLGLSTAARRHWRLAFSCLWGLIASFAGHQADQGMLQM